MSEYEVARLAMLKEWISKREIGLKQINQFKHMALLLERSMEGSRQHLSVATDEMLYGLRELRLLLSSIHHDINREPPA